MVGVFSRFFVARNRHRRSQTTLDERVMLPPDTETPSVDVVHHGIEVAVELKPVEHPTQPLDHDQPVHCPLPEPSILNDGRIWKERVQRRVADVTVPRQPPTDRVMLPSISAPEHNILKLLQECNVDS